MNGYVQGPHGRVCIQQACVPGARGGLTNRSGPSRKSQGGPPAPTRRCQRKDRLAHRAPGSCPRCSRGWSRRAIPGTRACGGGEAEFVSQKVLARGSSSRSTARSGMMVTWVPQTTNRVSADILSARCPSTRRRIRFRSRVSLPKAGSASRRVGSVMALTAKSTAGPDRSAGVF
jgi:hypothetical protein